MGVVFAQIMGCASKVPEADLYPKVRNIVFEETSHQGKRIVFRFDPEVPGYELKQRPDGKSTEVIMRVISNQNIQKEYNFNGENGLRKVSISTDSGAKKGTIIISHNNPEDISLVRTSTTDLVLAGNPHSEDALKALKLRQEKRVNLNVRSAPIDKVMRSLAAESNKNLVLGGAVTGNVTVDLKNLTYEQAVDMILRPTPYRAEHQGDVTIIRSGEKDKNFRSFRLRYVDVNMVLKSVQDIATKDGQVTLDPNSNSIFVVDKIDVLRHIEEMLATMDQPLRQVEVEAAILEVQHKDGIEAGFDFSTTVSSGQGSGVVNNDIRTNKISPLDPTFASTKAMFVGVTWKSVRGILGLLASKSKLNVLARPRVLAISDQEASLIIGSKLGYKTVTVTPTGSIEDIKFLVVGTQLKIKPHITMNNDILMYLKPEVSDGAVDPKSGVPSQNTTTSETKVLAKNGQTIVIGGLLRDRVEKKVDKVPILGDIPVIGLLFSGISNNSLKNEVVILLSPRLLSSELAATKDREGKEIQERFYEENDLGVPTGVITTF